MKDSFTLFRWTFTILVATSFAQPAQAVGAPAEENARRLAQIEPRIKAIYETNEFTMRSFGATWLPDGSGYLKLETPASVSVAEIASYDCASGKRTVAVSAEKHGVPDTSQGLVIRGFVRSPKANRFLLHTDGIGDRHGSGQTVLDDWGSGQALFHRAVADLGYIVVTMDNRGTPAPKGAA